METHTFKLSCGVATFMDFFPAENGPPSPSASPVLMISGAMGVPRGYYVPLARNLAAQGLNVATTEWRGHGDSPLRPSWRVTFGHDDMLAQEFPAWVEETRRRFPGSPLYLMGHSMGGHISSMYLSQNPQGAAGLILAATPLHHYRQLPFPKNLVYLGVGLCIRGVSLVAGYYPGHILGWAGREARGTMADWYTIMRTGRFRIANSPHNFEADFGKITLPLLSIGFSDDSMGPEAMLRAMENKLSSAVATRWRFTPADLNAPELGHFRWARNSDVLASKIAAWVNGQR
ncbi:MAG: alpha/beta fold hydrolase [Deltaproteobacteria bacterium]|nr:alpha/beta fold hydrolase [Deltaproteobacteria bacterium]